MIGFIEVTDSNLNKNFHYVSIPGKYFWGNLQNYKISGRLCRRKKRSASLDFEYLLKIAS